MRAAALLAAVWLAGCAALMPPQPGNTAEAIGIVYATESALVRSAVDGFRAGRLSADEFDAVLDLADQVDSLADAAAAALELGDVTTAEDRLAFAQAALTQLELRLK